MKTGAAAPHSKTGPELPRSKSALALWSASVLRRFGLLAASLFGQFAEPMQCDRCLCVIDLMAATKSPDSNPLKACSLDHTHNGVLLLLGCDSVLVPGTKVDWRIKKVCAGLQSRISVAQVVFIRTGDINSDDMAMVSSEKRRNVTNAFSSPGEPRACDRPLLRPGKAPVKRIDGSHCHGLAPRHIVILCMLWAVPRE